MRGTGAAGWALLRACHPEPTLAVTAIMTALALTTGHGAGAVLIAAAVLAGQLSIGWLNDAVDAERDALVGRRDKPVAGGAVSARAVGAAAVLAGVVCVPLSLASGVLPGVLHLVAVGAGWAYDLGVKGTRGSVLPYVVCFALMPVYVVLAAPGGAAVPWWLPAAGGLLGAGAHFANVLPDLDDDARTGVRGLPHRIGAAGSRPVAAGLLLAASVLLAVGVPVPPVVAVAVPVVAAAVLGWGLLAGRRAGSRAPFRAVLVVAVLDAALLVAAGPALTGIG